MKTANAFSQTFYLLCVGDLFLNSTSYLQ